MSDLTEADYRAISALSGTGIADLLRSPADYRYKMDHPSEPSDAMRLGTIVHALILEAGAGIEVVRTETPYAGTKREFTRPCESWQTESAKVQRAEIEARGMVAANAAEYATAEAMAEAVLGHPAAAELLGMPGAAEVSLTWHEGVTPCKGRIDYLAQSSAGPVVIDIKTTRSLDGFNKSIGEYGYHAQLMHYRRGALSAGALVAPLPFLIAVRNEAPHHVAVYQLSERDAAQGEAMCLEAYQRYADCMSAGVWPSGIPEGVIPTDIPTWSSRAWDALIEGVTNVN